MPVIRHDHCLVDSSQIHPHFEAWELLWPRSVPSPTARNVPRSRSEPFDKGKERAIPLVQIGSQSRGQVPCRSLGTAFQARRLPWGVRGSTRLFWRLAQRRRVLKILQLPFPRES